MLISLTGPSGVGKGYVKERIVESYPTIVELVWTTTRALRPTEQTSSNRKHVSVPTFDSLKRQGLLVCVQSLHGHFYGLEKSELDRSNEVLAITETNIGNMTEMSGLIQDFLPIALIPSDVGFLRDRLMRYRREQAGADLESRLIAAELEVARIKASNQFALVVEVSKENEARVPQQVLTFLQRSVGRISGGRT